MTAVGIESMKSVVRDVRAGRQMVERVRPVVPRPVPDRGRYEAIQTEVARLLEHLKRDDLSDHELRSFTIRMAKLQRDLRALRGDLDAIELLSDQVVELILKRTS